MTPEALNALEALEQAASAGPWHVRRLDDEDCMGGLAISTHPDTGRGESMRSGEWRGEEMVAACLIQAPPYVVPADDRFEENAALIATMRNVLPELIRLARLGLQA
ncbi:hypothetical protein J2W22_001710 [Sphingomonas kyeonggiensis]|uniref:hypothetical protein n=1 Tax=Sphingomonas kyeonggiensis TaxID=1268553 RepID=UPI002780A95E|nr:hypothetical protein [Sphingomonas kyeonggiensis]MDQ0249663.1 hypothetical protein [Sphingomonas kyeonggiensis]